VLDEIDRRIINSLQGGFPLSETPFDEAGNQLGIDGADLIERLDVLLETGHLSRFGPMFNVERMGGAFCLCAMAVPPHNFERIVEQVNAFAEVAHNYERAHVLNMWFVLAAETPDRIAQIVDAIAAQTGIEVLAFPKLENTSSV